MAIHSQGEGQEYMEELPSTMYQSVERRLRRTMTLPIIYFIAATVHWQDGLSQGLWCLWGLRSRLPAIHAVSRALG